MNVTTVSRLLPSAFRPCAIIPTYNHSLRLPGIVRALTSMGLPVIVVDDGSAEPTASIVREMAHIGPDVSIVRLTPNQGKGAAVAAGLRAALQAGLTHALQVDADGQHDLEACHEILKLGCQTPEAVICGTPIYDGSVPLARKFGRYITHVCVWIETASLEITDSMCGFRLYPIEISERVLREENIGSRMEFDIAVLVHLYWRGAPVRMLPIKVTYPSDNTSNFRLLADNLRISWAHTRLLIQAPFRLVARALRSNALRHYRSATPH